MDGLINVWFCASTGIIDWIWCNCGKASLYETNLLANVFDLVIVFRLTNCNLDCYSVCDFKSILN